jgi:hypothetical protein
MKKSKDTVLDPLNVNGRLYEACSKVLDEIKSDRDLTVRDRIAAITAVGRVQVMFMGLRKESGNDADAGSAVRKYAKAFDATGKRKEGTRPSPAADDDAEYSFADDESDSAA